METVFITIHDLSLDARIKYCSASVEDILGYLPHEIKGKSCWEYFHPDEIPFAKTIHGRGISLEKAAVLNYCRVKHRDGRWIGCECVFTVVYDVLVASTSVYQCGPKSRKRAIDGANIRRIFSSSPRDPRYHMLSYISDKFYQEPKPHTREPRAALFLNRFTRTSTIMFATNGVSAILGLQPQQLIGKSFYYCIAENCLEDAVQCLESAKGNDSIAYLRFWYRDPTQDDRQLREQSTISIFSEDDDDDGGVSITSVARSLSSIQTSSPITSAEPESRPLVVEDITPQPENDIAPSIEQTLNIDGQARHDESQSRSSSDNSANSDLNSQDHIFDTPNLQHGSSTSSTTPNEEQMPIEIEAVVSCTSDGLVVVLRRARPLVPHTASITDEPYFANGLFASPWATDPVMPSSISQTTVAPAIAFPSVSEPVESGFMAAIRDITVFAWSLTGINGSLVSHARGEPKGESLPPGGLPVWDPNAPDGDERHNGFLTNTHRRTENLDPEIKEEELNSSDDEILWKRVSQQPPWRRPKRRDHHDAFGDDGDHADRDGILQQTRRRKF